LSIKRISKALWIDAFLITKARVVRVGSSEKIIKAKYMRILEILLQIFIIGFFKNKPKYELKFFILHPVEEIM
jgi:hypothetical protein